MERHVPEWKDRESLSSDFKKWALEFSKTDEARFLGHLEMVNVFVRALRRSRIPVKYSEGFHPKPRISFEDTLPVGMESTRERFFIYVDKKIDSNTILEALNPRLPLGLKLLSCVEAPGKSMEGNEPLIRYQVTLKDGFFNEKEVEFFQKNQTIAVSRINKKGIKTELNLKDRVSDLTLVSPCRLIITLNPGGDAIQRPAEILRQVFHLSEDEVKTASVIKC
jgi:radical SAM-linked protein